MYLNSETSLTVTPFFLSCPLLGLTIIMSVSSKQATKEAQITNDNYLTLLEGSRQCLKCYIASTFRYYFEVTAHS